MKTRHATPEDVAEMSRFLQHLAALGKRISPTSEAFVLQQYVDHPDNIQCTVVEDDDGTLMGFQILKCAAENNIYDVTPGWGIIGTHVRPDAARRGVGRKLFAETQKAAQRAGLQKIDASISAENAEGLAYYDAIGFQTYRTPAGTICKCFDVSA